MLIDGELEYITIDNDRYGGAYSMAEYTAWVGNVPDDVSSDDLACHAFWLKNTRLCGKGGSLDEALLDLIKQYTLFGNTDLVVISDYYTDGLKHDERFFPVPSLRFREKFPLSFAYFEEGFGPYRLD